MQEYKKITFREFLTLESEELERYKATGKLLRPDSWGVSDFMQWPYLTVKQIQSDLSGTVEFETIINIIRELTGQKKDKILNKCWIDVFKFINFVYKSIERVDELEKKLEYEPDANEIKAGIDMFNQFGYFATIDRLAGGDPLKYDEVGKMEYSVIFSKLLLNQTDNQFMKNYHKAISK